MANPNIQAATACYFDNTFVQLTSTATYQVLSNAASSNQALLVDSIAVANVDGTNAADITLAVYPTANGTGTPSRLARTVTVPANATLIVVGAENKQVLTENESIYANASAANRLELVVNFKRYS